MQSLDPAVKAVIGRLGQDGPRLFGSANVRFRVLYAAERETSWVVKLAVASGDRQETVFVKVLRLGAADPETLRVRALRDFEFLTRLHRSMPAQLRFAVATPLACYPDHLAVITAEVSGQTLSDLLERHAAWWPSAMKVRELGLILARVGGWIRAFQSIDRHDERFALDKMRAYLDVRLQRLLATAPPVLDPESRRRVLGYFDRTAALVEPGDLQTVLTHADLAPSNVLVCGDRVAVIDFAMVAPGGLFMDVARLATQLEFLTAKPKFRRPVIRELQQSLLAGFDPTLHPERPLYRLFVLQHLLCHMSNLARNPAPPLAGLYNRHQLRLRKQWLETLSA